MTSSEEELKNLHGKYYVFFKNDTEFLLWKSLSGMFKHSAFIKPDLEKLRSLAVENQIWVYKEKIVSLENWLHIFDEWNFIIGAWI